MSQVEEALRVEEAICAELNRQGVRDVFGLMGEDVAGLIAALPPAGFNYYSSRHEHGAIGMADGYARVSGQVGVAVISRGPGLMNSLNALKTASKGGVPLVVLAADSAAGLADPNIRVNAAKAPKHLEQAAILAASGIRSITLDSPASAVADLRHAFDRAREGATVVVNLPLDVLRESPGDADRQADLPPVIDRSAPDPAQISAVADLLETSERPVILAGRGSVRAGAKQTLVELGERIGAVLATSLLARSMFAGDPYNAGLFGAFATPPASELFGEADVLLVFGATLNGLQTYGGELAPRAKIVQFDADPTAFGRFSPVDLEVLGDVKLAAAALEQKLAQRGHSHIGYRTPAVTEALAGFDIRSIYEDQTLPDAMDPRTLLIELESILPKNRTHVVDAGHHMSLQAEFLSVTDPEGWVWPLDFSSIGSGLAVAFGAALGRRDRPTVLGLGDGGLMLTLGELETAVRYHIPVTIILIDDSAYGAEVHFMDNDGLPTETAKFPEVNFEAVAKALGADAMTVTELGQLADLPKRMEGLDGPLVVDCKINPSVRAHFISIWGRLTKPLAAAPASA
jgi:thiamine pyrophosphate-dependent acetolactate synthase large subunit-like protein